MRGRLGWERPGYIAFGFIGSHEKAAVENVFASWKDYYELTGNYRVCSSPKGARKAWLRRAKGNATRIPNIWLILNGQVMWAVAGGDEREG